MFTRLVRCTLLFSSTYAYATDVRVTCRTQNAVNPVVNEDSSHTHTALMGQLGQIHVSFFY